MDCPHFCRDAMLCVSTYIDPKSRQFSPPAQQYERKKDASLSRHARDNHRDVVHEHVHGDGQEDDTEKLAQDEDEVFAHEALNFIQ